MSVQTDIKDAIDSLLAGNENMGSGRWAALNSWEVEDLKYYRELVDTAAEDIPMRIVATVFAIAMENRFSGPHRSPGFLTDNEADVYYSLTRHFMKVIERAGAHYAKELEDIYQDRNIAAEGMKEKLSKHDKTERFKEKKGRELYDRYGASKVFSTKIAQDEAIQN